MLKIRLQRVGRKNDPSFRVVVMDSRKDSQSGKFLEILGSYDARQGKPQLKADRIKHWLKQGAQSSGTVHNLLVSQKAILDKKVNVMPKRKTKEKETIADTKAPETLASPAAPEAVEVPA